MANEAVSERGLAERLGVPCMTLRHWRQRREAIEAPRLVTGFFESPEGTEMLHRLLVGAHFVITLLGGGGVRLVCRFLELTGLSAFVAPSYGVRQRVNAALKEAVIEYARTERERLAEDMPLRTITVCEDETFHPDICLVGLEAVSNFLLLEAYAEDRSARTWTAALQEALEGLPVEVIQATGVTLARQVRQVEQAATEASAAVETELGLRPIDHQQAERVSGHLFISLLAYHLLHTLRATLEAGGIHQCRDTLRRQLEAQQRVTVTLVGQDGRTWHIRKRTRPEPHQKTLYDALGIDAHPGPVGKTVVGDDQEARKNS